MAQKRRAEKSLGLGSKKIRSGSVICEASGLITHLKSCRGILKRYRNSVKYRQSLEMTPFPLKAATRVS